MAQAISEATIANIARAEDAEILARNLGLEPSPSLVSLGADYEETTEQQQKFVRQRRRSWGNLPTSIEAIEWLRERVRAEQRHDIDCTADDLQMIDNGELIIRNHGARAISKLALRQFFDRLIGPRYAGQYLADIPPARRAVEFNHILAENPGVKLKFRLRRSEPSRPHHVFAVTSRRYVAYDPDTLADDLLDVLYKTELADSRCQLTYQGTRTTIRLVAHTTARPENFIPGEIFRAVHAFRIGDDKQCGIHGWTEVHRDNCRNMMSVRAQNQGLLRTRHYGRLDRLSEEIMISIDNGAGFLTAWLELWSDRRNNVIIGTIDAIRQLTDRGLIKVAGVKPDTIAERVIAAYRVEPEATQVGIVNAITRAAHESSWPSIDAAEQLQECARKLLEMKVERFNKQIEGADNA